MPAGATAGLVFGASNTMWGGLTLPLTLPGTGLPGCPVAVSPDVVVPLTPIAGAASLSLNVPANPALIGQSYYNQAIVLDPGANALGITTSNGAHAVLGAR